MMTSAKRGSSSIVRQLRPNSSQAISVEPEPPNGSSTSPLAGDELATIRSMSATGFVVGCRSDLAGWGTEMIELASSSMDKASPRSR